MIPPALQHLLAADCAAAFRAHAARWASALTHRLYFGPEGVTATLAWTPEGSETRYLEGYYGMRRIDAEQFREYVHCGFHGLLARALTQWDLWSHPAPEESSNPMTDANQSPPLPSRIRDLKLRPRGEREDFVRGLVAARLPENVREGFFSSIKSHPVLVDRALILAQTYLRTHPYRQAEPTARPMPVSLGLYLTGHLMEAIAATAEHFALVRRPITAAEIREWTLTPEPAEMKAERLAGEARRRDERKARWEAHRDQIRNARLQ